MDETLELRLIESCYDSAKARQVSLKKAGEIIRDEIFGSARDNPAGALYFDGWAQVIVRTGLGHSIMNGQSLAVTGGDLRKGLFVYSDQDDLDGQRSSVFVEGAG
ncbi:MAG TPA: hypothetical protein VI612_05760, partial [Candidatus Nanoarchaeia archaeon]|nr:hypothetical protein [Candidatus Nanoarchaeia archaeon]